MARLPAIARDQRIYAIGDVHGRLDLFTDLVRRIRADAEREPAPVTKLLLLGDIVDRGPNSRALLDHLIRHGAAHENLIVLRGNHEQMMLQALKGDLRALAAWVRFGGDATLRSFGLSDEAIRHEPEALLPLVTAAIPVEIFFWLNRLPLFHRSRDFFFVHAGINPDLPLDDQDPNDLLWIREEFTESEARHPAIIVHGHTIVEDGPHLLPNRIAVDTGAYRTDRLSAVAFEGDRQWTITTGDDARETELETVAAGHGDG